MGPGREAPTPDNFMTAMCKGCIFSRSYPLGLNNVTQTQKCMCWKFQSGYSSIFCCYFCWCPEGLIPFHLLRKKATVFTFHQRQKLFGKSSTSAPLQVDKNQANSEKNGSLICLFSVYPCETTSPPTRLFCKDLNLQNHPLKTLSPCIKLNDCLDVLWKIKWLEKKVLLKKKNTWRIKFFNLSKRIWTIALI